MKRINTGMDSFLMIHNPITSVSVNPHRWRPYDHNIEVDYNVADK